MAWATVEKHVYFIWINLILNNHVFLCTRGSQSLFPHLAKEEVAYVKHSDGKDRFQCLLPPCLTLGSKFTKENTAYYCSWRLSTVARRTEWRRRWSEGWQISTFSNVNPSGYSSNAFKSLSGVPYVVRGCMGSTEGPGPVIPAIQETIAAHRVTL